MTLTQLQDRLIDFLEHYLNHYDKIAASAIISSLKNLPRPNPTATTQLLEQRFKRANISERIGLLSYFIFIIYQFDKFKAKKEVSTAELQLLKGIFTQLFQLIANGFSTDKSTSKCYQIGTSQFLITGFCEAINGPLCQSGLKIKKYFIEPLKLSKLIETKENEFRFDALWEKITEEFALNIMLYAARQEIGSCKQEIDSLKTLLAEKEEKIAEQMKKVNDLTQELTQQKSKIKELKQNDISFPIGLNLLPYTEPKKQVTAFFATPSTNRPVKDAASTALEPNLVSKKNTGSYSDSDDDVPPEEKPVSNDESKFGLFKRLHSIPAALYTYYTTNPEENDNLNYSMSGGAGKK